MDIIGRLSAPMWSAFSNRLKKNKVDKPTTKGPRPPLPPSAAPVLLRPIPPRWRPHAIRWWKRVVMFWNLIVGVSVLAGLAAAWVSLRSSVVLQVGPSLAPTKPFETQFMLVNESPFDVHDLAYACEILKAWDEKGATVPLQSMMTTIVVTDKLLDGRGTRSLRCDFSQALAANMIPEAAEYVMNIRVLYRPSFWPYGAMRAFRVWTKRDTDGHYQWMLAGPAQDLDPAEIDQLQP